MSVAFQGLKKLCCVCIFVLHTCPSTYKQEGMKPTYSTERKSKGSSAGERLSNIINRVNALRRQNGEPVYKDSGNGDPWFSRLVQEGELRRLTHG